jgi:hypothetical protein
MSQSLFNMSCHPPTWRPKKPNKQQLEDARVEKAKHRIPCDIQIAGMFSRRVALNRALQAQKNHKQWQMVQRTWYKATIHNVQHANLQATLLNQMAEGTSMMAEDLRSACHVSRTWDAVT